MKPIVNILFLTLLSFSFANAEIKGLTVTELERYIKLGIKVIDARKPENIKRTGVIPTSYRVGFYDSNGTINENKWMNAFVRILRDKKVKFVLVTQTGKRAQKGVELLKNKKGYTNPYYLIGGFEAWEKANKRVIKIKE